MSDIERLIEASSLGTPDAVAMRECTSPEHARRVMARAKEIAAEDGPDLWNLLGGPKPGFCCQDAYASASKPKTLHTSGCPNRCSVFTPVPDARLRRLPAAYPCGLTAGHDGDHWLHPNYRPVPTEATVRADERRRVADHLERTAMAGVGRTEADTLREVAGWCRDDRRWTEGDDGR